MHRYLTVLHHSLPLYLIRTLSPFLALSTLGQFKGLSASFCSSWKFLMASVTHIKNGNSKKCICFLFKLDTFLFYREDQYVRPIKGPHSTDPPTCA